MEAPIDPLLGHTGGAAIDFGPSLEEIRQRSANDATAAYVAEGCGHVDLQASDKDSTNNSSFPNDNHKKICIQHNHQDHKEDPVLVNVKCCGSCSGALVPFPPKLCKMLTFVMSSSAEGVVSWQPHQCCFVIHLCESLSKMSCPSVSVKPN